jgi:hypothetical protein
MLGLSKRASAQAFVNARFEKQNGRAFEWRQPAKSAVAAVNAGDQQIVARQLKSIRKALLERRPAFPIVCAQAILERDWRIAFNDLHPVVGERQVRSSAGRTSSPGGA